MSQVDGFRREMRNEKHIPSACSCFQDRKLLSFPHHEISLTKSDLNFGFQENLLSNMSFDTLAKVVEFLAGETFKKSFVCKVFVFATIYLLKVCCFSTCLAN